MDNAVEKVLRERMPAGEFEKLARLENEKLRRFVAESIKLCNPNSVFVATDSTEDIAHIRRRAIEQGEERQLVTPGHTAHFDSYLDQGRDRGSTKYLLNPGVSLGERIAAIEKQKGLTEVFGLLRNSMTGRQMLVRFFCLGPTRSKFAISGVQITDSAYVAHSEDLLYRSGYEQFRRLRDSAEFFRVLHSQGELENCVAKNHDLRRVYIDLDDEIVYSVNTQYAGNTVGFKKLSLRLAIHKANREEWLAEHMFVMGARGPQGRVTYFCGAFPSACGKTSTAMMEGHTIIGDDLAYLRRIGGEARAVNVECGIFGIIQNVNSKDDPILWKALTTPNEVIFSNILIGDDNHPYWLGDGRASPDHGINHSGEWRPGKIGPDGEKVPLAHKNARYTVSLSGLANLDPRANDPKGVTVGGIIYGGRDSDTSVPVQQALNWKHGVIAIAASLESETTAATLGKEGVRSFQPMSNLDFVSIPLGRYIQNHLRFAARMRRPPLIFAVNYFIKGADGKFLTGMTDKNIWLRWMELRTHGEVEAITIPTGQIPRYEDLRRLFAEVFGADYRVEQYREQFKLRVPENLAKLERIEKIYREQVDDAFPEIFKTLEQQRRRLEKARRKHGDYIAPECFI